MNGRRVPKESIGKYEDESGAVGSRGVMVFPGDRIQLGASTRIFVLEGPEDFSDETPFKQQQGQKQQQQQQGTSSQNVNETETDHVSWGMRDYDEEGEPVDETDNLIVSDQRIDFSQVPSSHQKLLEKIRAKEYKLTNLQRETERIEAKGGNAMKDLTEGQRAQLLRNQEREANLLVEVQDLKHEIQMAIRGEHKGSEMSALPRTKPKRDYESEDEEDHYFDRTLDSSKTRHEIADASLQRSETEGSLTSKWRKLVATLKRGQEELESMQRKVHELSAEISRANDDADYDTFFLTNDLQLNKENLIKASTDICEMEKELSSVEKLLRIVNSKLLPDRRRGVMCEASATVKQDISSSGSRKMVRLTDILPPSPERPVAIGEALTDKVRPLEPQAIDDNFSMPPPLPKLPSAAISKSDKDTDDVVIQDQLVETRSPPAPACSAAPKAKENSRRRTIGPTRPPDNSTVSFLS